MKPPAWQMANREAMLKLIYLFLLTMPGTPFIYYGDEIGMRSQVSAFQGRRLYPDWRVHPDAMVKRR